MIENPTEPTFDAPAPPEFISALVPFIDNMMWNETENHYEVTFALPPNFKIDSDKMDKIFRTWSPGIRIQDPRKIITGLMNDTTLYLQLLQLFQAYQDDNNPWIAHALNCK